MPRAKIYQSSFNLGVMSPEMAARIDIEQYYRGAKTIDNGIVLPQGGVTKRDGFELLSVISDLHLSASVHAEGAQYRAIPYIQPERNYIILICQVGHITVYSETGNIELPMQALDNVFGDAIEELQYKQVGNDLVIISEWFAPFIVIRNGQGKFEVNPLTVKIPKTKFADTITGSVWGEITVTFNEMVNGDYFSIGLSMGAESGANAMTTYDVKLLPLDGSVLIAGEAAEDMAAALQVELLKIAAGYVVVPIYSSVKQKVLSPTKTLIEVEVRTFAGLKITKPDGKKMLCVSKSTHKGSVKTFPTGGVRVAVDPDKAVEEPVWSENRGYPTVAGEHGGRFILGGTPSLPETLWLSRIYAYYDFTYNSTPVATDAIEVTIATERSSKISGIIDSRRLTILTTASAFVVSGEGGQVVTPDSIKVEDINQKGAKLIRPQVLDGDLFYVQQSGAELNTLTYDFTTDSYQGTQASIYSSHLLDQVKQMCKTSSSDSFNSEYLTVVNRDGTAAVYSSLKEQQVQNWTRLVTKGEIVDVCGIGSELFAVVRRGHGVKVIVALEKMVKAASHCDHARSLKTSSPISRIDGLSAFVGNQVVAIADGYDIEMTVKDDGSVLLPFAAKEITIGLPFDFVVEPMPVNIEFKSGMIINSRKRINKAEVSLLDSRDVTVEYAGRDYKITDRLTGFKLGEPPQPFTGIKTKRLLGWINNGSIKIKSNRPVPLTVLGVELTLRTKG